MNSERFWTVPNLLTLSRIPLTAILCVCISQAWWFAALVTFGIASLTDWIDGWWARRFHQLSTFGRVFDPLVDKILIGGAFVYLIPVPEAGLLPWMVTVVIGRELLVTGIRGYIEALGKKFGADWFGKLKMILQCVALIVILAVLSLRGREWARTWIEPLAILQTIVVYAMVAATIGSGLQYCVKATKLVRVESAV